jgi:hypothetical protein
MLYPIRKKQDKLEQYDFIGYSDIEVKSKLPKLKMLLTLLY